MKLKTKLLPLVGIAATAAVVTPLVTSCKLSKLDIVDITKGYTPTTKSSVSGELTQQEATQTYINDVKTNSEIFRQDFLYGVHNKVTKIKNSFLNSPNTWKYGETDRGYVSVANFKLNSLKAGVSTPTFGSTTIMYPGEPSVTYPTISFEYSVQVEYTYEYIGLMARTGEQSTPISQSEQEGYHSKTVTLETNVKYTNVPFLAVAHKDSTGKNTYWQVTPLDTIETYASEDDVANIHYYNQDYIFQYMSDDWSIDLSASATINEKHIVEKGDTVTKTKTPTYNLNITSYEELSEFTDNDSIGANVSYDLANYVDMMTDLTNFGFESYYLSSVAQKPEIQTNGNMQGYGVIDGENSYASFGAFYLPQSFDGTVKLYAGLDTEGTPTGAIELNSVGATPAMKVTIAAGTELDSDTDVNWQYGVNEQALTWDGETAPTAGSYNFQLPTTVVAQFTLNDTAKTTWNQVVYLNQNTLQLALEAA